MWLSRMRHVVKYIILKRKTKRISKEENIIKVNGKTFLLNEYFAGRTYAYAQFVTQQHPWVYNFIIITTIKFNQNFCIFFGGVVKPHDVKQMCTVASYVT